MRTSPTNIGLQLLAIASAHDLGLPHRSRRWCRGSSGPSHRSSGCPGSGATSTTGTTSTTSGCSHRRTSRRWTAATWPASSSPCARPASASPTSRSSIDARGGPPRPPSGMVGATASARIEPKLRLVRSALAAAERASDLAAGLDGVLGQLEELEQVIAAAREPHAPLGAASEWAAWTRRLVAEQRRRVEGLGDDGGRRPAGRSDPRLPDAPRALGHDATGRGARRAPGGPGRQRQPPRERDGLQLPLRRAARALLHRIPAHQPHAGPVVLRPPGLRGAAGQLRGHRQGRRARWTTGSTWDASCRAPPGRPP